VLDTKEKSFAAKFLADPDALAEGAKGPSHERGFLGQATNLRVWDKSGRLAAGLSWASYVTDQWADEGTQERLTLVFASRYVVLWGSHLLALVRQIDEGRLRNIVEADELRAEQLRAENADIRDENKKAAIVLRAEVGPEIETMVSALKGEEEHEARHARRFER
jgi:hypothetical protein